MKPKIIAAGILVVLAGVVAGSAWAQSGGGYNLGWSSIDSGGGVSSANGFTLRGTIGQTDVGSETGGGFTLEGGIWAKPVLINAPVTTPEAAPGRNYFTVHHVTLTWNRISWATAYQIQVARNSTFTVIAYTSPELSATTLSTTTDSLDNGTYYWHVRIKNSLGIWSTWGTSDIFDVNAP